MTARILMGWFGFLFFFVGSFPSALHLRLEQTDTGGEVDFKIVVRRPLHHSLGRCV